MTIKMKKTLKLWWENTWENVDGTNHHLQVFVSNKQIEEAMPDPFISAVWFLFQRTSLSQENRQ